MLKGAFAAEKAQRGKSKFMMNDSTLIINRASDEVTPENIEHPAWETTGTALLNRYWSGENAPSERCATARLLWTPIALLVRFDCEQHEPLIINHNPILTQETAGLWEKDVCELFVAPDCDCATTYCEFEVAPTGEWLDYKISQQPDFRETDTAFDSGMQTAAWIRETSFTAVFSVAWTAFSRRAAPVVGERWAGNFFRCVGTGATRGYLAWQPTRTAIPNFHVPQAFGAFEFQP